MQVEDENVQDECDSQKMGNKIKEKKLGPLHQWLLIQHHACVFVFDTIRKIRTWELDVVIHTCNPSTWKAETGGLPKVWGQELSGYGGVCL